MFRPSDFSIQNDTEFFDSFIRKIEADKELNQRSNSFLHAASSMEPLLSDALRTPQDIRYHAEGPFVLDHLRLMLICLYAIFERKMPLKDIEELRRIKGFELKVEEMSELFCEHISWFEAYVLCHDAAKWATVAFESPKGSRGEELGFNTKLTYEPGVDLAEQVRLREAYLDLYFLFEKQHANEPSCEIQSSFYLTYEIDVSYLHHDNMIHTPVFRALLERFMIAHKLTEVHAAMLKDIIGFHLDLRRFGDKRTSNMRPYFHLAKVRGYDADDFIDFIQCVLFLDYVCASKRLSAHGYWHDIDMIVNALRAEHDFAPQQRAEKQLAAQEFENKRRNKLFRDVGLDGIALMSLFNMEPGAEFGRLIKRVQWAVIGKADMPTFNKKIDDEIACRAGEYYKQAFVKGE